MKPEQIQSEIALMREWCEANYNEGADTMVECWTQQDYESLFTSCSGGKQLSKREAWQRLKAVVSVYRERQADADYYASQG
jgi:hypothetical protein